MGNPRPASGRRTRRARQGRLKSVTYTGCWTCRTRKVKCDERHENGCVTCERAGIECKGYGVNLCWVTGKKSDPTGRRRRQIKLDQPSLLYVPEDELDAMLSTLDTISSPVTTITVGPFAIFQTGQNLDRPLHKPRDCAPATVREYMPADETSTPFSDCLDEHKERSRTDSVESDLPMQLDLLDPDISQFCWAFQEDSTGNIPMATLLAELDDALAEDEQFSSVGHLTSSSPIPFSPQLELSMPLFHDADISMLMYHYMNHVAELLQPVLHPQNPWRTTYFRFALEGCDDAAFGRTSLSLSETKVSTAIFHGVLSSAAFHLRNATVDSSKYHKLGLQHRAKALQALNGALALPQDPELYTVYLTAMLSLVTIDTMTGEDSDFPIHLDGCHRLQKPQSNQGIEDTNTQVNSICHFLTLLARTTSCKPIRRRWQQGQSLFEELYFHEDERSIEYIYGITPALGNLLQRTCHLAEYIAYYKEQEYSIPPVLLEACRALKMDLLSWELDPEEFHVTGLESVMIEIARCQAHAFHSAVVIFFYRAIGINCALNLDHEVQSTLRNLTRAEDLKDQYMGGEKRTAPMSWPAFVAACEATEREPWVEWWTRVQGYKVGNFKRQWSVIRELWEIMDEDMTVVSWRDALRKSGKLVLPI